jgi:hypothetical protein
LAIHPSGVKDFGARRFGRAVGMAFDIHFVLSKENSKVEIESQPNARPGTRVTCESKCAPPAPGFCFSIDGFFSWSVF